MSATLAQPGERLPPRSGPGQEQLCVRVPKDAVDILALEGRPAEVLRAVGLEYVRRKRLELLLARNGG